MRSGLVLLGSILIAATSGMDMTVARKLLPDAHGLLGYLYQFLGRVFRDFSSDRFAMLAIFCVSFWLLKRYLFCKPKNTGAGEYLLCALFGAFRVVSEAFRQAGTVAVLWADLFQLMKTVMLFVASVMLMLCLLRGLNEWLHRERTEGKLWLGSLWEKHPFVFPMVVLTLLWLPQIIVKYPGVIDVDTAPMINGGAHGWGSDHFPSFDIWLFSRLYVAGQQTGQENLFYFLFVLLQCGLYIVSFSYLLMLMKRRRVSDWILKGSLLIYGFSPAFSGWAVTIGKDSLFFPFCMLLSVLLWDSVCDLKGFFKKWWLSVGILLCTLFMSLSRPNGIFIAIPAVAMLIFALLYRRVNWKCTMLFSLGMVLMLVLSTGISSHLITELHLEKRFKRDAFSIVFQPTATVVVRHGSEIPSEEQKAIDGVLHYDWIQECYDPDYAKVNSSARTEVPAENLIQYFATWWKQLKRYPLDYVDAFVGVARPLIDLQETENVYYSITNPQLTYGAIYPASMADMFFYDEEQMAVFDDAQRLLTEWYHAVARLPLLGELTGISCHFHLMLMMLYLCWCNKRRLELICFIPSLMTGFFGFISPIVLLRLQLPMLGALPLWFAGFEIKGKNE